VLRAICPYASAYPHSRRWRLTSSILLALATLLLVCGCGGPDCRNLPPPDLQPPTLQLPHVQPVHGLDDVLLRAAQADLQNFQGYTRGIEGLTTYQAFGGSYALATLSPEVYALPLPDGPAARVKGIGCAIGSVALTADATRLACLGVPDAYGNKKGLLVAAFTPGVWPPRATVLQDFTIEDLDCFSPTWRPDGGALAVLEHSNNTGQCDIALLAPVMSANPRMPTFAFTARFTVAGELNCEVIQLAWSSDGHTLAALAHFEVLLLEPPREWLTVPDILFHSLPVRRLAARRKFPSGLMPHGFARAHGFAWAPDGHRLVVLLEGAGGDHLDGERLALLLLDGSPDTPLVPISPGEGLHLGAFTWTPDGSGLLFAYGEREDAPTWRADSWFTSGFAARPARPLGFGCFRAIPPPGLFFYDASPAPAA
jgi:hypothetical protein